MYIIKYFCWLCVFLLQQQQQLCEQNRWLWLRHSWPLLVCIFLNCGIFDSTIFHSREQNYLPHYLEWKFCTSEKMFHFSRGKIYVLKSDMHLFAFYKFLCKPWPCSSVMIYFQLCMWHPASFFSKCFCQTVVSNNVLMNLTHVLMFVGFWRFFVLVQLIKQQMVVLCSFKFFRVTHTWPACISSIQHYSVHGVSVFRLQMTWFGISNIRHSGASALRSQFSSAFASFGIPAPNIFLTGWECSATCWITPNHRHAFLVAATSGRVIPLCSLPVLFINVS